MNNTIQKNSFYAWILAARPKTLTGAIIPVLMGSALSLLDQKFSWIPALVCLFFAGLMQIAANFINDLYDYLKGSDREDRLGPERACAQGWISPYAMKWGIAITIAFAGIIGCILIYYGGWNMIWIGIASIIFAFLYTTCLSYYGFGDIMVVVFFGLTAVGGTYYVQALQWTTHTTLTALACGLVIETLLIVNNYRDYEADKESNKKTLIVRFGKRFGEILYLSSGWGATMLMMLMLYQTQYSVGSLGIKVPSLRIYWFTAFLPIVYLIPHYLTWKSMIAIGTGKKLNSILGKTSRNMLLFGLLSAIGMILDYLFPYILS